MAFLKVGTVSGLSTPKSLLGTVSDTQYEINKLCWMSSPRNLFVFICLNLNSQKLKSGTRAESKVFLYSWGSLVSGQKHGLWTPTAWVWIPTSLMTICVTLGKLPNLSVLQFLHWSKEENCACVLSCFSHFWLCVNLWTVALQTPLSLGFFRPVYQREFPCSSPGDLPHPGIEPPSLMSPALAGKFFTTSTIWEVFLFSLHQNGLSSTYNEIMTNEKQKLSENKLMPDCSFFSFHYFLSIL